MNFGLEALSIMIFDVCIKLCCLFYSTFTLNKTADTWPDPELKDLAEDESFNETFCHSHTISTIRVSDIHQVRNTHAV